MTGEGQGLPDLPRWQMGASITAETRSPGCFCTWHSAFSLLSMPGVLNITIWHWVGFVVFVLVVLALDLGVFHRKAHVVEFREALLWSAIWFCLAMLFALWLGFFQEDKDANKHALQFVTGYLIELSLSMDNVFVIALIFGYFRIPSEYQHRVLFWGILGALVMRGFMIGVGVALITLLSWVLYVFGAFLIFSGIKMLFVET